MVKTQNYNLNKPEADDFYDISLINQNTDKIDSELKRLSDSISKQTVMIITASGAVTLPAYVKYIDIIIVDGGGGGSGGAGSEYNASTGPKGIGGVGGGVLCFNGLKLQGSIYASIGAGGAGGNGGAGGGISTNGKAGASGASGGATALTINGVSYNTTAFSDYKSQTKPTFCPITAEFYGKNGIDGTGGNGVKFGDGGNGGIPGVSIGGGGIAGQKGGNGVGGCVIIRYIGDE